MASPPISASGRLGEAWVTLKLGAAEGTREKGKVCDYSKGWGFLRSLLEMLALSRLVQLPYPNKYRIYLLYYALYKWRLIRGNNFKDCCMFGDMPFCDDVPISPEYPLHLILSTNFFHRSPSISPPYISNTTIL
jgi:hypothetical protein